MNRETVKITILGAGISGLATAYWLNRDGYDVTVLEAGNEPGGSMESRFEDGFLIECGPNSGLDTTPLIHQMVRGLDLTEAFVYANEANSKRYILRNNRLHCLPTNPMAFLSTELFSPRAKLRILAEPFIGKSEDGYYQSISEFVTRRLGREFLDYAINPFVAGVFAGNPDNLSVKSAFPKLYRLEEQYGGLFKGLIKGARERKARNEQSKQSARIFSFKKGMQTLPIAIARKLGHTVRYNCTVERITESKNGFESVYTQGKDSLRLRSDVIVSAVPAYRAARMFDELDGKLAKHLDAITYPPVKVLFLGFAQEAVGQSLDGFGFLVPEKEDKTFLGAIWSSALFPERAADGLVAFTLYIGGARSPELFDNGNGALTDRVEKEFREIMAIDENPVFVKEKFWSKAIPQYNVGYIEHERYFETFETMHPGIFLAGNFRGGISVGDCIQSSKSTADRIHAYIRSRDILGI